MECLIKKVKIRKHRDKYLQVTIPAVALRLANLTIGDKVDIFAEDGKIVLRKIATEIKVN